MNFVSGQFGAQFEFIWNWLEISLWHRVKKLCDSIVSLQSIWLNFIFWSFLVKRKSISCDRSIDNWSKVWVLFDDVSLFSFLINILSSFEHLSENLNPLSLNFGNNSFFIFSFCKSDCIYSLCVFVFTFFLSFYQSALKKIQSLILNSFDVFFSFWPFSKLLIFHQFSSENKTGLIWSRRKSLFKGSLFSHWLN